MHLPFLGGGCSANCGIRGIEGKKTANVAHLGRLSFYGVYVVVMMVLECR